MSENNIENTSPVNEHEELKRLAEPLTAYLQEHYHHHACAIVTFDHVRIAEVKHSVPFIQFACPDTANQSC